LPWIGIWFESAAETGASRSPEHFQGLVPPIVYPYAHGFVEAEEDRLRRSLDPGGIRQKGVRYDVWYSIAHDGGQSGLDQQGCRILRWLFGHFALESGSTVASRFSEIPVVIHADNPVRAAALGNALTLLRFLAAREDQAIAKILIYPWTPVRLGVRGAALDFEKRVLEFLHGEIFYPETVDVFDVLARRDLKEHRELAPCCRTQIGFIESLLEWIDEEWPETPAQRAELRGKLARSLADEAAIFQRERQRSAPKRTAMDSFR
jgi:hypothetical protein